MRTFKDWSSGRARTRGIGSTGHSGHDIAAELFNICHQTPVPPQGVGGGGGDGTVTVTQHLHCTENESNSFWSNYNELAQSPPWNQCECAVI